MAIEAKVGNFSIASTDVVSTIITISGLGFAPSGIMCWWNGRSELVDTLGRSDIHAGAGYATDTLERGLVMGMGNDGSANTKLFDAHRMDALVGIIKANGTSIDGLADIDGVNGDGFTLIIDQQFAQDIEVQFLAFGGDSIEDITVNFFQSQNALGTQDITDPGFPPDAVFMLSVGTGSGPPSLFDDMQFTMAAMKSTTEQGLVGTGSRSGQGSSQSESLAHQGTEAFSTIRYSAGQIDNRFKFDSVLANGFRIEHLLADDDDVIYMAVKGGDYSIGELQTRTDGADITVSGLISRPAALMFFSHNDVEDDPATGGRNSAVLSIGAATGPNERLAAYRSDIAGLTTTRLTTAIEYDAVYIRTDEASGPVVTGLMDISSIEDDGFIAVMDDPDPTAAHVMFWAFGPAAAPIATAAIPRFSRRSRNMLSTRVSILD